MSTAAPRTVPAPRKDLNKVRKRSRAVSTSAATATTPRSMDIEALLASLTDDNALVEFPVQEPVVNYYAAEAPQNPPPQQPKKMKGAWEPRLLIRQVYKLANEACAVVGLESARDFKPSIYLVNDHATVSIILSDLISLTSTSIQANVDRHLSEATFFKPLYLNQCLIEPSGENTITIFNHRIVSDNSWWNKQSVRSDVVKESQGVQLSVRGWNSLKRHLDCIENYYSICAECADTVLHLLNRYARFLTKHYRAEAFLAGNIVSVPTTTGEGGCGKRAVTLHADFIQRITNDVPLFLHELNEKRLPLEIDDPYQQYQSTPMRLAMLPWLDSEVRRFCTPNLVDTVLDNLKYHYIW